MKLEYFMNSAHHRQEPNQTKTFSSVYAYILIYASFHAWILHNTWSFSASEAAVTQHELLIKK